MDEWKNEPDFLDWDDGIYHCIIRRNPVFGHLCGYVGVPSGSPHYGIRPDHIFTHGGITYEGTDIFGARKEFYYFGFDCAHVEDLVPYVSTADERAFRKAMTEDMNIPNEVLEYLEQAIECMNASRTYKNIDYVRGEVESLIKQIRKADFKIS